MSRRGTNKEWYEVPQLPKDPLLPQHPPTPSFLKLSFTGPDMSKNTKNRSLQSRDLEDFDMHDIYLEHLSDNQEAPLGSMDDAFRMQPELYQLFDALQKQLADGNSVGARLGVIKKVHMTVSDSRGELLTGWEELMSSENMGQQQPSATILNTGSSNSAYLLNYEDSSNYSFGEYGTI